MLTSTKVSQIQASYCDKSDEFWKLFNALGDCVRYRITKVLINDPGTSVTDLARICGVSAPAVSQHLRVLERTGLVIRQQVGKAAHYQLNYKASVVNSLIDIIDAHLTQKTEKGK